MRKFKAKKHYQHNSSQQQQQQHAVTELDKIVALLGPDCKGGRWSDGLIMRVFHGHDAMPQHSTIRSSSSSPFIVGIGLWEMGVNKHWARTLPKFWNASSCFPATIAASTWFSRIHTMVIANLTIRYKFWIWHMSDDWCNPCVWTWIQTF